MHDQRRATCEPHDIFFEILFFFKQHAKNRVFYEQKANISSLGSCFGIQAPSWTTLTKISISRDCFLHIFNDLIRNLLLAISINISDISSQLVIFIYLFIHFIHSF